MEFVNHTPFPALAFQGIDQFDQRFHVVVVRQTFTWNEAGELIFAAEQQPLCKADDYLREDRQGGVRQESDLCQYKPRCDVIVNATAYPPTHPDGTVPQQFDVQLVVRHANTPPPLPPKPYGLNPLMPAAPEVLAAWQREVERVKQTVVPGERLIDKTLVVSSERAFVKRAGWARFFAAVLRFGTLGWVRMPSWRLQAAPSASAVAVSLEQAYGGQCRIDADSPAADKVPKPYRLSPEQAAEHPDAPHVPVAHDTFLSNPAGKGFVRDWYLNATGIRHLPASRIEYPGEPLSVDRFYRVLNGDNDKAPQVAGLGVRPKGHPARAKLTGTIDRAFIESDDALPKDFDFAVWNAAWPDQQLDVLRGDEYIDLRNLCDANTPAATRDRQGNIALTLALPGHLPFVLVRYANGAISELEARLDTVLIDPEQRTVSLVWRASLGMQAAVRVLEARMLMRDEVQSMRQALAASGVQALEEAHG